MDDYTANGIKVTGLSITHLQPMQIRCWAGAGACYQQFAFQQAREPPPSHVITLLYVSAYVSTFTVTLLPGS